MMESSSPGSRDVESKRLMLSGGVWSASNSSLPSDAIQNQEAVNNSQFLLIAVEYVNEGNIDYKYLSASTNFTSDQEFSEINDNLNTLDPSINSTEYSSVYSPDESNLNNDHQQFTQNSIVILPNTDTNLAENQTNYTINSVENNVDILQQVVSNGLCRSSNLVSNLKEENDDSVELLIDENIGISYTLNQDNRDLTNGQNIDRILNTEDVRLQLNEEDRLIDSQSLVLDSNNLISLDDHVLMENGTLVLKSDLNSVVQQIDLNNLETNIAPNLNSSFIEEHDVTNNEMDQLMLNDNVAKSDANSSPLKVEINKFELLDKRITEHNKEGLNKADIYGNNNENNVIFVGEQQQAAINATENSKTSNSDIKMEIDFNGHVRKQIYENELIHHTATYIEEHVSDTEMEEIMLNNENSDFNGLRRSKRQLYGKEIDDYKDIDLFTDCPDCTVDVATIVLCARHHLVSISDKPVPSRARATLPAAYLAINKVGVDENGEAVFGVFARKLIPKRTQFGPIEGVIMKEGNINCFNNVELLLENEDGIMHKMDTSNENLSNWMRFVRKADTFKQQNLILNQMGPSLYYISTCNIFPRQELMVGYSVIYAKKRGLSMIPNEPVMEEWPCFECDLNLKSSQELEEHLNTHDEENNPEKSKLKRIKKKKNIDLNIKNEQTSNVDVKDSLDINNENVVSSTEKDPLCEKENREKVFYTCNECKKNFGLSILLQIHSFFCHSSDLTDNNKKVISSTTNIFDEYICPECDEHFPNRSTLAVHVGNHQIKIKKHKCHKCYKYFATLDRLQKHMLVHSCLDIKPLKCPHCSKRFLNNSALTCHAKTHLSEKVVFECAICKVGNNHVLNHKEHVKTHGVDGIYTCPHCSKEFKEYSVIRKHIRAFHCDRKHECFCCGKLFATTDKLRMHLLKHSDHREFLCAICGKQFKRKDKLKEHTKCMHSGKEKDTTPNVMKQLNNKQQDEMKQNPKRFKPKIKPTDYHRFIYKCHTCLVGFKRRGMLVNHLAKRHPDIRPDSVPELNLPILRTTRDYFCQYCDKVYKSSSKRKAHIIKNHPGSELPPNNRTREIAELQGIMNPTYSQPVGSVTTDPYNCQWCHKQYASKAKLLQHQRNKHADLFNNFNKNNNKVNKTTSNVAPADTSSANGQPVEKNQTSNNETSDTPVFGANENELILPTTETEFQESSVVVQDDKKSTKPSNAEFLNTDGFDADIFLNIKDNNKVEEQIANEILQGEYRIASNGQCYRIIPVSEEQQSNAMKAVGDSLLRALLSSTTPVNQVVNETPSFVSYIPPR